MVEAAVHPHLRLLPRAALLSLLVSLVLSSPAWARREYFDQICAMCHSGSYRGQSPGDSPTCAGCHYHAGFSRNSRGSRRFHGWTDKSLYQAGEIVTVFMTGGDRPGWVRTHVVDQEGREVARATGPTGMGDDSDPSWTASLLPGPIVLKARAPYLPGTYQWKVGWFGDVAYPNPAPVLEHQGMQLRWDDVPLPPFDVYSSDTEGPAITALTVTPTPTGGVREVRISALASDAGSGMTPLAGASFLVDCMGGETLSGDWAPLQAADGKFDSADEPVTGTAVVPAPGPAQCWVSVKATDALGNEGPAAREWLEVTSPPQGDSVPPEDSCLPAVPAVVPPGQPVLARVNVDDRAGGGSPVYGGEAFLDAPGQNGTGFTMGPADGALDSSDETLEALLPTTGLADGTYPVLMHGVDAAGIWSPYCTSSFEVEVSADTTGPSLAAVAVTPNPTRGAEVAVIRATASDAGTGYGGVVAAEFFLDPAAPPGEGTPMQADDGAFGGTDEKVTGVLDVSGWAPGAYIVGLRARDDRGLWGVSEHVSLQVSDGSGDQAGPSVVRLRVSPDPVNGAATVRLRGWIERPMKMGSRISRAEYFLESSDAPPGPRMVGTGLPIAIHPGHGAPRFSVKVDVSGLPAALHSRGKIFVRAMDAHGNWGPLSAIAFWMTGDPSIGM